MMKKNLPLLFLLIIANDLKSQCKEGNCYDGYGIYEYSNGPRYEGNWQAGQRHGQGVLYHTDGSELAGVWDSGELVSCICKNADGSRYEGEIRNQKFEGEGTYYFTDGGKYVGEWKDGERNGQGILYDGKKVRYKGAWKDGELHGQGTYYFNEGGRYEGSWVKGMKEGIGTLYYKDGNNYTGRWANDMRNGKGTLAFSDGSQYTGDWKDNQKSGRGTYYFNGGDKYVGEWKDNLMHGEGTYYFESGHHYSGEWKNGKRSGFGVYTFDDGKQYIGQWKDGLRHGAGKVVDGEKVISEGFWINGEYRSTDSDEVVDTGDETDYNDLTEAEAGNNQSQSDNGFSDDDSDFGDSKVYAVIVGVAKYNHSQSLQYADDDAYKIYAHLKSPEGGALPEKQIVRLIDEDASKENIIEALESLFARADGNDLILFYFSGHGRYGAFVAFDSDNPAESALYHTDISEIMKNSKAKHKIVIADACHSGSLKSSTRGTPASDIISGYYETLDNSTGGSGTAILVSSKAEETSEERSGIRQGVFSFYLIKGLSGEADTDDDKVVSLDELYRFVRINTMKYTNNAQTPTLNGSGYDPEMPLSIVRDNE